MKNIVAFLLLFTSIISAQNASSLFSEANNLYKEGKYQDALNLYKQIENQKSYSSELYYNIGNCYYKLNQVAPTIYNYEKSLALNPQNEDAQNNLIIAKRLTLDRIEKLPQTLFQKLDKQLFQQFHYETWAIITIVLSIIASILFLLFYFSNIPSKKRLFFVASISCFLLLISTFLISFQQYNTTSNNIEAIIFSKETGVNNAPTINSEEVFILHEGTKVRILDTVDDWNKIKLIDGKIGWILNKNLKIIHNF